MYWLYIVALIYYGYILVSYIFLEIFTKKTEINNDESQFESLINTSL